MPAIIFAEIGCTGSFEMSSFQGLSGGKTCKAARIASASGVLNWTGRVICGIFGRSAPTAASAMISDRGHIHFMGPILTRGRNDDRGEQGAIIQGCLLIESLADPRR